MGRGLFRKGFTLIELLLVAVILVVAAAMAVPNFARTTMKLELKRTAEDMAYTIRFGQLRAMTKGRFVRLNMDTRGYWLEEDRMSNNEDALAAAKPVFGRAADRWGRRINFPKGIELEQSQQPVVMSPDGRMAPVNLRLCREEKCLVVSTTEQRGRVEISEANDKDKNALL